MVLDVNKELEDYKKSPNEYLKNLIIEIINGDTTRLFYLKTGKVKFNADKECIDQLINCIEQSNDSDVRKSRLAIMGFFGLINSKDRIEWLKENSKSDKAVFVFARKIPFADLCSAINDESLKAVAISELSSLTLKNFDYLIATTKDPYFKEKIYYRCAANKRSPKKVYLYQIKRYERIKEEIAKLSSEEEKVNYIVNLKPEEETIEEYNDINLIKKSLLEQIKEPQNRDAVISSMSSLTKPPFDLYKKYIREMIIEYLSTNEDLTREMLEKIDITFNSFHLFSEDLSNVVAILGESAGEKGLANGDCNHIDKIIRLDKKLDISSVLNTLLHELGHGLSFQSDHLNTTNSKFHNTILGTEIEEGVVESFTQNVWKSYFTNHDLSIDGKKIDPYMYMSAAYRRYVTIIKTIMSKFSINGEDKEIFKDYLLGDKERAYKSLDVTKILKICKNELDFSPELLSHLYQNCNPQFVEESYMDNNILLNSLKKLKNYPKDKLPKYFALFVKIAKYIEKTSTLDIDTASDFDEIFDKRKLYDISPDEIDFAFTMQGVISESSTEKYTFDKDKELSDDERKQNSPRILQNLLAIAINTNDPLFKRVKPHLFEKYINLVKEKNIDSIEDLQKYIELNQYLTSKSDDISSLYFKPDGLDEIQSLTLDRIKEALLIPDFKKNLDGKYSFKDLENNEALLKIFKDNGVIINDNDIIQDVCEGLEKSKSTIDDVETTSISFERSMVKRDKEGAERDG
ncbi:MAG: hypothetical protein IKR04_05890 [Clostridia bacterium]|nr:hypothetical protein [Clostridia bacterium]